MKHFAAWCQEEENFSGSWDLGHQLQIASGNVMKANETANIRTELLCGLRRIETGVSHILYQNIGSNILCVDCNSTLHTSIACPYLNLEPPAKKPASSLKIFY